MKKVYIVDDDKSIIESLSMVLESEGYSVGSQNSEEDVVDNTSNFSPDLIILDVMFPEDESAGFTIARKLKADDKTSKIPIIMLSAINERGIYAGKFSNTDKDDSYLPVNEFIEKPVDPKILTMKVKNLIG